MLSDRAISQNLELYPHSNINLQFICEMFYFFSRQCTENHSSEGTCS